MRCAQPEGRSLRISLHSLYGCVRIASSHDAQNRRAAANNSPRRRGGKAIRCSPALGSPMAWTLESALPLSRARERFARIPRAVLGMETYLGDLGGAKGLVEEGIATLGAERDLHNTRGIDAWRRENRQPFAAFSKFSVDPVLTPRNRAPARLPAPTRTCTASASLSTPASMSARACKWDGHEGRWVAREWMG